MQSLHPWACNLMLISLQSLCLFTNLVLKLPSRSLANNTVSNICAYTHNNSARSYFIVLYVASIMPMLLPYLASCDFCQSVWWTQNVWE